MHLSYWTYPTHNQIFLMDLISCFWYLWYLFHDNMEAASNNYFCNRLENSCVEHDAPFCLCTESIKICSWVDDFIVWSQSHPVAVSCSQTKIYTIYACEFFLVYQLYYCPFHFNPSCLLCYCRVLDICRKIIYMDRSSF